MEESSSEESSEQSESSGIPSSSEESLSEAPSSSELPSSSEEVSSSEQPASSEQSSSYHSVSSSTSRSEDYGWNVNFNEYGKTFATTLASLINARNPKTTSYSDCRSVGAKAAAYPNANSSTFIPFYHGPYQSEVTTISSCNREHTWPNSRGGNLIEKDPLVIRPTLISDNSARGNNFYGIGTMQWDPASCGYEGARGESARVILYAATRYASLGLSLSNNPSDNQTAKTMGTLSTLLEWNNKYAPSEFEKTVNERYAAMGYARNPFVDCPDFANYIYTSTGYRTSPYAGGEVVTSSSSSATSSSQQPSSQPSSSSASTSQTSLQSGTWNLVTATDQLSENDQIVFACNSKSVVAGAMSGVILPSVSATFTSGSNQLAELPANAQVFTVGRNESYYTFSMKSGLLGVTEVKKLAIGNGITNWNVSISNGTATVASTNTNLGALKYNSSSPRFTTYASGQTAIQIYKLA